MSHFDQAYAAVDDLFGAGPHPLLERFWDHLPAKGRVLDIGVGQGRHALFLARHGFEVHGIDPSAVAVRAVERLAAEHRLPIRAERATFERYRPAVGHFDGVLAFGLLPLLTRAGIDLLRAKIRAWTASRSVVWVTGFTSDDPGYARWAEQGVRLDAHSFERAGVGIRSFLQPGELPGLFADYEVLEHRETLGPWHQHGDEPPERHAVAEIVLRR